LSDFIVVSCEHAGKSVPPAFRKLFARYRKLLDSHRGFDPGALELARTFARRMRAPLHYTTVTRLLVEPNRSIGHPALFSKVTRPLPRCERDAIATRYYFPYRNAVETEVETAVARGRRVIHLSMHSFTPVLDGVTRTADVGFLYDPTRPAEGALCKLLQSALRARRPELAVRRNYPYLGISDGVTTSLRKRWSPDAYLGIEIEVNQRWPAGNRGAWRRLRQDLAETAANCLRGQNIE
jgi:predicted N-formylglutamate amidohydrolase